MKIEEVILVDSNDSEIGLMEKMEAHEKGLLHRAFSVFLFNDSSELLLQKRASTKYHSPDLWTNTCCSHPRKGETIVEAGKRRLVEEMGITADLKSQFTFIYKAELDQGLTEHEYDHVLFGSFNSTPNINLDEVSEWKYVHPDLIQQELDSHPQLYTEWFKICFPRVLEALKTNWL